MKRAGEYLLEICEREGCGYKALEKRFKGVSYKTLWQIAQGKPVCIKTAAKVSRMMNIPLSAFLVKPDKRGRRLGYDELAALRLRKVG